MINDAYTRVDLCMQKDFSVRWSELDYYDELILDTACADAPLPAAMQRLLERSIVELEDRLLTEIKIHKAITPQAAAYAERLQQLRTTLLREQRKDDTQALALLCFAVSFDLRWFEEEAKAEKPLSESTDRQFPPLYRDIFLDDDDEYGELPF